MQPDVANPSDPSRNVLFDFSEFTYNDGGLYLNSSQVDMFAVPHTVSLVAQDGSTRVAGTLVPRGRNNVIQQIKGLADWQRSVIERSDGTVLRILAPAKAAVAGLMSTDYLDGEITRAWNAYTSKNLTIVPFGDRPNVKLEMPCGLLTRQATRWRVSTSQAPQMSGIAMEISSLPMIKRWGRSLGRSVPL
ncbi:glucan endo-1,3-beta-glucosidase [Renibacterium salmoninarum ATCC 33209]|uniref:Glucan endo-1,3-beta-glucosidase n=1 Tax=Renibacterium salmoninarum (strain ATCC 33209 / DSM 20767 / JCM 11484 / NBRC 15589 / NCIMB 2235) TaxID=288705 RepID=A9WSJ9_RENSM|nr:glucan endo-1,3-beta-glucosidase [Renibacterium salmoninarum ATCC 33209]